MIALLAGIALSIASETTRLSAFADSDALVQHECNRAARRITDVLRKTGWNDNGTETFPNVSVGGSELRFRMLEDLQ